MSDSSAVLGGLSFHDVHTRNVTLYIPGQSPFSGTFKGAAAIGDLMKRVTMTKVKNPDFNFQWTQLRSLKNGDEFVVVGRCELQLGGKKARSRVVIEAQARNGKTSKILISTSNQASLDRLLNSLDIHTQ